MRLDYRWRIRRWATGAAGRAFRVIGNRKDPGAEHTFKIDVGFGPIPGDVVVLTAAAACDMPYTSSSIATALQHLGRESFGDDLPLIARPLDPARPLL